MGLILAAGASLSTVLGDQWKEYFYCSEMPTNVLVRKGEHHTGKSGLLNKGGSENVITNGSTIVVNEGQCMIIVDQGAIVDICAEPGAYTYDTSSEPSIFSGNLGQGIKESFKKFAARVSYGGVTAKDQRVYYFNTKNIIGNKYGTASPVPFRVVDKNIGLDLDISVRCFGEYSYRICNPILFYTNICGNVSDVYPKQNLDGQLRAELLTALQPAFAAISEKGIRYSALPGHANEICAALNEALAPKWRDLRGIEIVSFGVSSATISEEDEKMIKELQRTAALKDPAFAAAHLAGAQAQAMQAAANNTAGAATGFYAMNMAAQAGGMNAANLFNLASQQAAAQPQQSAAPADSWTCPSCGTQNHGKFCMECGAKKPSAALKYRCDKCGWVPSDPTKPPKFCPECGDPFNVDDVVS